MYRRGISAMKKIFVLILVIILLAAMAASALLSCGDSQDTSVTDDDTQSVGSSVESNDSAGSGSSESTEESDSSESSGQESTASGDDSASSDSSSDTQTVSNGARPVGVYTPSGERQLPIYNVQTDEKKCAISFDAAWGADQTENLLDILEQYNVKATFFLVGRWVDEFPEMTKKIAEAGHDVMNHSNTHADLATLSYDQIIEEIETCNDKIEAITGVRPALIRLPYGSYNNTVISAVRSLGMEPIQWDVDSLDWKDLSASEIYSRVTGKVSSGSIVLFHNAALHTPEALEDIIEYLLSEGYEIVPVSQIIITGDYTIDNTGRQFAA